MNLFQLGQDVDVRLAIRQAVAAGNAGGAVFGDGLISGARVIQFVVIEDAAPMAEDAGNADGLRAIGNAIGAEQTGQAFILNSAIEMAAKKRKRHKNKPYGLRWILEFDSPSGQAVG